MYILRIPTNTLNVNTKEYIMETLAPVLHLPFSSMELNKASIISAFTLGLIYPVGDLTQYKAFNELEEVDFIYLEECDDNTCFKFVAIDSVNNKKVTFSAALASRFNDMTVRQWRVLDSKGTYVRDLYTVKPFVPFSEETELYQSNPIDTIPNPHKVIGLTLSDFKFVGAFLQYAVNFIPTYKVQHDEYFNVEVLTLIPIDQLFFKEQLADAK